MHLWGKGMFWFGLRNHESYNSAQCLTLLEKMGCRGSVYRPALRGQWNDMEARWRYVSSSSDSRCWWDPEHSCCCCALADIHCLLLILPVPDPQVCMGGRLPVLDICIYALPGSVRQGSEQGCTCFTLGSAPSTEEVEGKVSQCQAPGQAVSLLPYSCLPAVQVTLWVQQVSGCRSLASFLPLLKLSVSQILFNFFYTSAKAQNY